MTTYLYDVGGGKVYSEDNYGKNMLGFVNGERCVIPVRDIPTTAARLDCTDEEVWNFVKSGSKAGIHTREDKSWRQRLMAWRGR